MAKTTRSFKQGQTDFVKLFTVLCGKYSDWQVWSDFVTLSAIAVSNAMDQTGEPHEEREHRYLDIINSYPKDEANLFPELLAMMTLALQEEPNQDFLGDIFLGLNLNSHWKGQFFTPYHICHFMAKASLEGSEQMIREKGWISIADPCCGAGALLIAARNVLLEQGCLGNVLFIAQDIDEVAALMCYLQLALLGCAGYVIVGNSLSHPPTGHPLWPHPQEGTSIWYLPMSYRRVWHLRKLEYAMKSLSNQTAPSGSSPTVPLRHMPALESSVIKTTDTGQLTLF